MLCSSNIYVKYNMASADYNVLLGAAALPDASRGHQVVIGTAADTVFFGGGLAGIAVSAAGVSLAATATITASGETGGFGTNIDIWGATLLGA